VSASVQEFLISLSAIFGISNFNLKIRIMTSFLERIFGEKVNIQEIIQKGAIILDVRSKEEFKAGHLQSSINIPVDKLAQNLNKLGKTKPIITCCASGMRSASAKNILKANGYTEVYNGGSWKSLKK
jgi:phage shock protein E